MVFRWVRTSVVDGLPDDSSWSFWLRKTWCCGARGGAAASLCVGQDSRWKEDPPQRRYTLPPAHLQMIQQPPGLGQPALGHGDEVVDKRLVEHLEPRVSAELLEHPGVEEESEEDEHLLQSSGSGGGCFIHGSMSPACAHPGAGTGRTRHGARCLSHVRLLRLDQALELGKGELLETEEPQVDEHSVEMGICSRCAARVLEVEGFEKGLNESPVPDGAVEHLPDEVAVLLALQAKKGPTRIDFRDIELRLH